MSAPAPEGDLSTEAAAALVHDRASGAADGVTVGTALVTAVREGQVRIEDLEEGMRRIVCVLEPDGRHDVTDRDRAVLAIALDLLGLDQLPPRHGCPRGAHPDCPHEPRPS